MIALTENKEAPLAASVCALLSRYTIEKREAEMLLAHVLGASRANIVAHPERVLDATQKQLADDLLARRVNGEPIAYLIGTREFYGRDFIVSPATLIPRPETELIVDLALARLSSNKVSAMSANASSTQIYSGQPVTFLDLGTGSGAIAVSIALEHPDVIVVATDISGEALSIAAKNAQRLGARVEIIESNWYESLAGRKFDLIVANPPYVAGGDEHLAKGDLRFEPQTALTDNSVDGLSSIRTIIEGSVVHLHAGGWLLFEHGYDQSDACNELLLKAGFVNLTSVNDLAGIPRVAGGQIR